MNFIRSMFEGRIDDEAHRQFKRFSKGNFENRAVVELNITAKKLRTKTTFEYGNWLVRYLANTIKEKSHITGGIITTKDITEGLGFDIANIKQFAGVKTYLVDCDVSKEDLIRVMDKFSDAIFCLSFSTDYGTLKVKIKAPKSAKPGKNDSEAKADYCIFGTSDLNFKNEFAFDVKQDFKKLRISHEFIIESLVVPDEYKNDFAKARVYAKRKGKIIRKINVDGNEIIKEKNFEV